MESLILVIRYLFFDEMRYINALIDYSRYKTDFTKGAKLFMANPYNLSFKDR
jgi:hypothetical protein